MASGADSRSPRNVCSPNNTPAWLGSAFADLIPIWYPLRWIGARGRVGDDMWFMVFIIALPGANSALRCVLTSRTPGLPNRVGDDPPGTRQCGPATTYSRSEPMVR